MDQPVKWVRASSLDELPRDGSGRAFDVDGLDIAVFNWDQSYFALENYCPHLGFPLTEGIVEEGAVICGWHGWRVRLDDGGCRGKTLTARRYACEVRGDALWVEVPEKVQSTGSLNTES